MTPLLAMLLVAGLSAMLTAGTGQAASTLPTLTFSASSSALTLTGTPVAGAVNIAATSTGKLKEPALIIVKLNPGATEAEVLAAVADKHFDPNEVRKFGAIVFDEEAPPGKSEEAQTTLTAGSYVSLVAGENGPAGPHTAFTVAASPAPAALPAPQAKIKTIEFGFKGPSTLKVGEVVGFEDGGFLVHMNIAFPAKSKTAAKKIVAGLKSGHEKGIGKLITGPPVTFQGPVSPASYQQVTIVARPGYYVEACFMGTQDGRPHTMLGMERIIHITK